jgi:hypothetical protein
MRTFRTILQYMHHDTHDDEEAKRCCAAYKSLIIVFKAINLEQREAWNMAIRIAVLRLSNVSRYLTQFLGLCSEVMEEYAVRHDPRVVRHDREGRVVRRRFRKKVGMERCAKGFEKG